ncbi:MAG: PAS domain-containing protein [Victivallales bacterium]|nr:PAS domain-containing protein [Victivallales bacterium]
MENIYAILLSFLEMTFTFVSLALLHSQRKTIGSSVFYISIGLLFLFMQFVSAAAIKVNVGVYGLEFYVGSTVLFLPYLAALLLVYLTEGTLAAQRMIVGVIIAFGMFFYLVTLTRLQCDWMGFAISQGIAADSLHYLLNAARASITSSTLAQILDLFILAIIFQRLRNSKFNLFICILGSLICTCLIDSFVYLTVSGGLQNYWWVHMNNSFFIKAIASIWLAFLITIYMYKIEKNIDVEEHSSLDIIFAFFGGYGKAKALEHDLREWEGRYRMVVENASEAIFLLDNSGQIIDANLAAVEVLGADNANDVLGIKLLNILQDDQGNPVKALVEYSNPFGIGGDAKIIRFNAFVTAEHKVRKNLNVTLSALNFENEIVLLLLARDITEESKLAAEKVKLGEQLAHSQRLEAVGKLAGGIAHDFNNYIHAILGHLDLVRMMFETKDETVNKHLEKIGEISEQAGELTSKLLGFARKGKYQEQQVDLNALIEKSVDLFMPKSKKNLELKLGLGPEKMIISGDSIQLQQVILNLMLNAMDAMKDIEKRELQIMVDKASNCKIKLLPPSPDTDIDSFYVICVKDNGLGIDDDTMKHIFDPFFTTKPVGEGTGMGLAMVYGTITNHHGWVQVVSKINKGTKFYLFLPKVK